MFILLNITTKLGHIRCRQRDIINNSGMGGVRNAEESKTAGKGTSRENVTRREINGYEIPEKSKVIVNAWALGRDPNHWAEAEAFNPERFIGSSVDYKGNSFEYINIWCWKEDLPWHVVRHS
ncbi:cytochrome P450, putative [Ricinus communis]|uniref:Cytochrome P450, putative n=1 Tax=Ricinus communis TaxID=3988 RepID=B9S9Q3_RICCO|nr:cytochrome P450, putative [Ricinus communis]